MAAYERYNIESQLHDVVLHPLDITPVEVGIQTAGSNWAKTLYALPKIVPVKKVVFFVLDTENVLLHPDLQEVVRNDLARTYTGEPVGQSQGHGIHCAGIIGSVREGLLYEYKNWITIIPFKVLTVNGTGDFSQIVKGVLDVPEVMKQFPGAVGVISMSLGGSGTNAQINAAIKTVTDKGIYVYCASGNNGLEAISTPANAPSVTAIGSCDENLTRSSFSNFGAKLYCVAPGRNINSTYKNGLYAIFNGTSMACPNAAATAGYDLMQGKVPLSGFRDLPPTGFDIHTGNGIYKPGGTVPPPPPPPPADPERAIRRVTVSIVDTLPIFYKAEGETDMKKLIVTSVTFTLRSKLRTEALTQVLSDQVRGFFKNRGLFLVAGSDLQEAVLWSGFFLEQDAGLKGLVYDITSISGRYNGVDVNITGDEINQKAVRITSKRLTLRRYARAKQTAIQFLSF